MGVPNGRLIPFRHRMPTVRRRRSRTLQRPLMATPCGPSSTQVGSTRHACRRTGQSTSGAFRLPIGRIRIPTTRPPRSVRHRCTGGRVVWADPRYRRSDVTPLKPFGGWPWSDRPQWSNNDLFYLSFAPTRPGGRPRPLRLTPDLSQVTTAVVRPVPKGFVVMWAGRSRVGKDATSAQQPAAVFMEVLPRR